jgi:hypothetical protein
MIQNRGMKIPMMNMTQCPLRIVMIPKVTSRMKYRTPPITNSISILPVAVAGHPHPICRAYFAAPQANPEKKRAHDRRYSEKKRAKDPRGYRERKRAQDRRYRERKLQNPEYREGRRAREPPPLGSESEPDSRRAPPTLSRSGSGWRDNTTPWIAC